MECSGMPCQLKIIDNQQLIIIRRRILKGFTWCPISWFCLSISRKSKPSSIILNALSNLHKQRARAHALYHQSLCQAFRLLTIRLLSQQTSQILLKRYLPLVKQRSSVPPPSLNNLEITILAFTYYLRPSLRPWLCWWWLPLITEQMVKRVRNKEEKTILCFQWKNHTVLHLEPRFFSMTKAQVSMPFMSCHFGSLKCAHNMPLKCSPNYVFLGVFYVVFLDSIWVVSHWTF